MAARQPKQALRRQMAVQLVMAAQSKGGHWLHIAAIIALSYIFGFRVPSELLRQSTAQLWDITQEKISYGPIQRKHRLSPVTLTRDCVCKKFPILCAHVWAAYVKMELPADKSFNITGAQFNAMFQQLHRELGTVNVRAWTSHAMRRGMALDVLENHGFAAMLKAGDWKSGGAFAYASQETVEQRLVGQMFAMHSDDDS